MLSQILTYGSIDVIIIDMVTLERDVMDMINDRLSDCYEEGDPVTLRLWGVHPPTFYLSKLILDIPAKNIKLALQIS